VADLRHTTDPDRTPTHVSKVRPIQVVLADDHLASRRSLRLLLERERDISLIAEAVDLPTAVAQASFHQPDVVVVDLPMRGYSMPAAIRRLRRHTPAVIVLAMDNALSVARAATEAGALGFVAKERSESELPEAIQSAARGTEYISPHVADELQTLRRAETGPERTGRYVLRAI
jgi:DNA-binding NarL/FixJ family response regulator